MRKKSLVLTGLFYVQWAYSGEMQTQKSKDDNHPCFLYYKQSSLKERVFLRLDDFYGVQPCSCE